MQIISGKLCTSTTLQINQRKRAAADERYIMLMLIKKAPNTSFPPTIIISIISFLTMGRDGFTHHLLIACGIVTKIAAITILHRRDEAPREPVELITEDDEDPIEIYPIVTVQQLEEIEEKFYTEREDECDGEHKHQTFSEVFYEYLNDYKEQYVSILYHHTITAYLTQQSHG